MAEEPANKRLRLDENISPRDGQDGDGKNPLFSPSQMPTGTGYGFENTDPFLSPATASSWPFDEFSHDPDYLASQEALRSLMFDTAQSVAPTRAGTPVEGDALVGAVNIKRVLADGKRIQYLKNYMSQVAPWVSAFLAYPSYTHRSFHAQFTKVHCYCNPTRYCVEQLEAYFYVTT